MGTSFTIKYDYFHSILTVLQNNKPVSQYSQFSRCNNQPFSVWYMDLPQYCSAEANASFSVVFYGGEMHSHILKSVFSRCSMCDSYRYKGEIITSSHRIIWLNDICSKTTDTLPKLTINISSTIQGFSLEKYSNDYIIKSRNTTRYVFYDMQNSNIDFSQTPLSYSSDIIVTNNASDSIIPMCNNNANHPQLIIELSSDNVKFTKSYNGIFCISCSKTLIVNVIRKWICDFILPGYYISLQKSSKSCKRIQNDSILRKECEMLTALTPYFELHINSKIQLGKPVNFTLSKYPEDLKCLISVNDSSAATVGKNGTSFLLNPQREGSYKLIIKAKDYPEYYKSADFLIYKYIYVNFISFNSLPKQIVVGDTFTISYTVSPSNAHNKNQTIWEISPTNNILTSSNLDSFTAVKPGKCTVTLKIGSVHQSINITVLDKAQDIRFDKSFLSIKLGNNTSILTTIVSPQNSAVGTIKYNVSNPAVLSFDSVNGQIITKAEGSAVLTAVLLDKNGRLISDTKCSITITPPKDIITPDALSVVAVLLLLSFIFLYGFDTLRNTCAIAFIVVSIISILKKRNIYSIISCIISVFLLIAIIFLGM